MYRETAGEHLHRAMLRRSHRLNADAAAYVFDLSRALSIATDKNVLSDRGKAIAIVSGLHGDATFEPQLSPAEQFGYFSFFLEADGPVMALLGSELLEKRRSRADLAASDIMQRIFRRVIDFYLQKAVEITARTSLRTEKNRLEKDYRGRTPQHKLDLRLNLLLRCGLIEERDGVIGATAGGHLERLAAAAQDLENIDATMASGHQMDFAARVLSTPEWTTRPDQLPRADLVAAYLALAGTDAVFVEVQALSEYLAMTAAARRVRVDRDLVERTLTDLAGSVPRSVRFHVDRRGRPAFVAVSPELLGV